MHGAAALLVWRYGRADDVINTAGYRIVRTEVENALIEHPAVRAL